MAVNSIKLRLKQILAVAKKNMKIYYTESPILIFGILFSFFLFLAFALGKNADLVLGEKKGYYVHYTIKEENLQQIGDYIIKLGEINKTSNSDCHENED